MIWTASAAAHRLSRGEVRFVYYGILAFYAVLGMVILWFLARIADRRDRRRSRQPGAGVLDLAGTLREPQALAARASPGLVACRPVRSVAASSSWESASPSYVTFKPK